ncbi:MAG: T9SS type A sorting domain-containing protein [Bacteroidetes bacterium]|nr:T9SS type A sorting domain-containing protein [Bacteroidota bacterium]
MESRRHREGRGWLVAIIFLMLSATPGALVLGRVQVDDTLCVPPLLLPVDDAGCLDSLVTFEWESCSDATAYRLQVLHNPGTNHAHAFIDTVVSASSFTETVSVPGMQLFWPLGWRVAALKDTTQGDWTELRLFRVKSWYLIASPLQPASGDSGFVDSVRLVWRAEPCAERYVIELREPWDGMPGKISLDTSTVDTSFIVRGLPSGRIFIWRVRPYSEDFGHRSVFLLSSIFRTHQGPPPVPLPVSPLDTVETGASVDLRWTRFGNTSSYDILVQTATGRTVLVDSMLLWTVYPAEELEYDTLYRWQVRARNDVFTGEWSVPQHFFVREYPVGIGVLPAAGGCQIDASFPQPLRGDGTVRYNIPRAQSVRLVLHDILGRERRELRPSLMHVPGWHTARVSADGLPPGTYFLVLHTPSGTVSRRMVIAR